jgi:hypothetical protein
VRVAFGTCSEKGLPADLAKNFFLDVLHAARASVGIGFLVVLNVTYWF